ncbi:nuclear receptor co-repressor 1 [Boothiomyces sp. JEL0838]|nr:nuclear receptor co-repressor 1 [Boothiomyces sp. JEL0838]
MRQDPQRDFRKRTQSQDNRPPFRNDFRREEGQRFPPDGTPKPYKRFPPSLIDSDRFRAGRNEQFDDDSGHQRYRSDIVSPEQKDPRFNRERFQNSPNMSRPFERDPRYMEQDWQRNRDVRNDRWMNRDRIRFERDREPYIRREESFHHQYQRPYLKSNSRYQRDQPNTPRDYRAPGMPQRDFFQNRPRSPQRWPPEQPPFDRREMPPYQRLYPPAHAHSNGPSLMASMGIQKRRRSIPGLTPGRFSMNEDDTKMEVDDKEATNVTPNSQKVSLLAAKKETPQEFSGSDNNSSSESDDMYDQEYIEEQIDRIDNEIAKQERMLTNVRTKIAAALEKSGVNSSESVVEEVPDIAKKLPEYFMEEFRPKYIQHNSKEPESNAKLIAEIYSANRKLNKTFRVKSRERDITLYNLAEPENQTFPSYDPAIFEKAAKVDVKLRSAVVRFLRNQKLDYIAEQEELQEQFSSYKDIWLKKVKKLESKREKASSTPTAPSATLANNEDSLQSASGTRSTRRTGFRSDVVRSEEEWQNALSFLGIVPDESKLSIAERCAKDVPMITDPEIRRQMSFHNTNNLVQDPERDLAAFNSLMDYKWSENDRSVFKANLIKYGKDFYKIAGCLEQKSTQDCVQYYYREKINLRFKNLLRRSSMPGRGRRRKEKTEVEEAPCLFRTYRLHEDEEVVRLPRKYPNEDEDVEESEEELYHKPQATEAELNQIPNSPNIAEDAEKVNAQLALWSEDEKTRALRGFDLFGKDFAAVSSMLGSKTAAQCKFFFNNNRKQQGDEEVPKKKGPGRKPGAKPRKRSESGPIDEKKAEQKEEEVVVDEENENEVSNQPIEKKRKIKEPGEKKAKRVKKTVGEEGEVLEEGAVQTENSTETARRTVSYWSVSERSEFLKALAQYGRNWDTIAKVLQSKSAIQVRNYFHNSRKKLKLDEVLNEAGHGQDEKPSVDNTAGEKDEEEVVEFGIVKQPTTPMAHSRKLVESLVAKLPQISEIVKQTEHHPPSSVTASVKNLISSPNSALLDPYRRMSLPALAQPPLQQNYPPGQQPNPNWSSYVKSRSPSFDIGRDDGQVKHEFIMENPNEYPTKAEGAAPELNKGEIFKINDVQQHKFIMENPKEGRRGSVFKSKDLLDSPNIRTPQNVSPNSTPLHQREFIMENPVAAPQGKRKSVVSKSPEESKKYQAEFHLEKPDEQKHKPIILKFKMGLPQQDQPTKVKSVEKVDDKPRISLQSYMKKQNSDLLESSNDREKTPPVIQTPALKQYGGLSEKISRSNSIHISSPVLKRVDPVINESSSTRIRGSVFANLDDLVLPKLKDFKDDSTSDHLRPISSIYSGRSSSMYLPNLSNDIQNERLGSLNSLLSHPDSPDLGMRKSNSFDHAILSRADIDPVQALMELSHGPKLDSKSENTTPTLGARKSHNSEHVGSRISSLIDLIDPLPEKSEIPPPLNNTEKPPERDEPKYEDESSVQSLVSEIDNNLENALVTIDTSNEEMEVDDPQPPTNPSSPAKPIIQESATTVDTKRNSPMKGSLDSLVNDSPVNDSLVNDSPVNDSLVSINPPKKVPSPSRGSSPIKVSSPKSTLKSTLSLSKTILNIPNLEIDSTSIPVEESNLRNSSKSPTTSLILPKSEISNSPPKVDVSMKSSPVRNSGDGSVVESELTSLQIKNLPSNNETLPTTEKSISPSSPTKLQPALPPVEKDHRDSYSVNESVGKVGSPVKETLRQSSPVRLVRSSPGKPTTVPGSPTKQEARPSSPVKQDTKVTDENNSNGSDSELISTIKTQPSIQPGVTLTEAVNIATEYTSVPNTNPSTNAGNQDRAPIIATGVNDQNIPPEGTNPDNLK